MFEGNLSFCTNINEKPHYGFLNMYCDKFGKFYKQFSGAIDLPDPDNTKMSDRKYLKEEEEKEKWSEDHYLGDLMEDECLQPSFEYVPRWYTEDNSKLNEDEEFILNTIPKCDIIVNGLSDDERNYAELQMIDVLLAYCYSIRTTEGQYNVECGWTVNKLSSTLCWLEVFYDLKSVLLSFYKRSLTYPLYRNWELSKLIHKDLVILLKSGSVQVTRCLIEVKEYFEEGDCRHILNTLFLNDLCHFAHSLSEERLSYLGDEIQKIVIEKREVQEDLILLEAAAKMVLEEENLAEEGRKRDIDGVAEKISNLNFDSMES